MVTTREDTSISAWYETVVVTLLSCEVIQNVEDDIVQSFYDS